VSLLQVNRYLSGRLGISFEQLLPHLAGAVVEAAELAGTLCLWVRARAPSTACAPGAGSRRAGCTAPTGGGWPTRRSPGSGC
jgi:hypothetical protein